MTTKSVKIYYEVEELDDGSIVIDCSKEGAQNFIDDLKFGCKRKIFIEIPKDKKFEDFCNIITKEL
jgi:hypothetical protein